MTGNPGSPAIASAADRANGEVGHSISPAKFDTRRKLVLGEIGAIELDELDTAGLDASRGFPYGIRIKTGKRFRRIRTNARPPSRLYSVHGRTRRIDRKLNDIPDDLGDGHRTGDGVRQPRSDSGSGWLHAHWPTEPTSFTSTTLSNARGRMWSRAAARDGPRGSAEACPRRHESLVAARSILEREFDDMQDFEFTVEEGEFLLQSARRQADTSGCPADRVRSCRGGAIVSEGAGANWRDRPERDRRCNGSCGR